MNILNCSEKDMHLFWSIVTSTMHSIPSMLGETFVPKTVQKHGGKYDSIEKCLWILRKKINFMTTSKLKTSLFQSFKEMIDFVSLVKFPVLIAVKGTHACYHHVVVIWKQMVIEFESKYTYPLTNDSLTQISGINTAFRGISCGYGIFPSVHIRRSFGIFDWGYFEYTTKKSSIRKYFKSK
jgi:hypothetical protein